MLMASALAAAAVIPAVTAPKLPRRRWRGGGVRCSSPLAERLRMGRLATNGLSYKESLIVRSYEVGANRTATIDTISKLMQEVACNHVQSLGFSTDGFGTSKAMRMLHLIWVVSRMHIEIYEYPAWGDVVEVETWYDSSGRLFTRRDWIIKDLATDEVLGRATGKLAMMNQETRKLQRMSDEVWEEGIAPSAPRLAFPELDNGSLKKIPKLKDPAKYSELGIMPRRTDFDMNQHVNYATYIGWVLESVPQEIIDTHELQTITLEYKRECRHDDMVDSFTSLEVKKEDNFLHPENSNGYGAGGQHRLGHCQFLHLLRLSKTGLEINRSRTEWRIRAQ